MAGAPIGNTNGTALKDPEERKKAYQSFCDHIAEGYPVPAWSYRNGENKCCWATMLSYIEKNPIEFEAFLKQEAHANSYKKWFKRGINLTDGNVKGNPSPQTWATIMRNMFHWDKEEKSASTVKLEEFARVTSFLMKAIPSPEVLPEKVSESNSNRSESPEPS